MAWLASYIITTLIRAHPDLVLDHRQSNHVYAPWSTLQGSAAEPLMSDENPESPMVYLTPTLHTDHVAADFMRQRAWSYRNEMFTPAIVCPGFIGHQTERSYSNGTLALTDNYIRDFDIMGFIYSLFSNIAGAGMNLGHTMIPARDDLEYKYINTNNNFSSLFHQWNNLDELGGSYIKNVY